MRITRSIIPNLFTLANLFSGFSAITLIADGDMPKAALFILLAGIFDALDGVVARLTKSASELGVELDSLCDAVSFGVVPAFMLYAIYFKPLGNIGLLIAALPALAGVYRLARFNAELTGLGDKEYFTGMPIPAGAVTLISFAVFFEPSGLLPNIGKDSFVPAIITVFTSLAMISRVKFDNVPRFTAKSLRQRPFFLLCFATAVIIGIWTKGVFVFPIMAIYLAAGFIRHLAQIFRNNTDDDGDDE
ncbi:CDP-diacylglycerol--serine O-phosphatidyltransferase [Ignavibacteria bacterium]|nr:CDP-diacylglycerol--serine O-phosphatidyltransferase [Bacteroidota bacterium]MCZ2102421.1 CDP-diacylglycerol--serine O-phosphatidyltransferase [Chitinophagales bacterium]